MSRKSYCQVVVLAANAFSDIGDADHYLRTPKSFLGGCTPLEAAQTPEGAAIVERHILWIAGDGRTETQHPVRLMDDG